MLSKEKKQIKVLSKILDEESDFKKIKRRIKGGRFKCGTKRKEKKSKN